MSSKDPALPLRHILQAIERIEQHVAGMDFAGMDFAAYRDDPKTADAVERNLQRISETAIRLGDPSCSFTVRMLRALGPKGRPSGTSRSSSGCMAFPAFTSR